MNGATAGFAVRVGMVSTTTAIYQAQAEESAWIMVQKLEKLGYLPGSGLGISLGF